MDSFVSKWWEKGTQLHYLSHTPKRKKNCSDKMILRSKGLCADNKLPESCSERSNLIDSIHRIRKLHTIIKIVRHSNIGWFEFPLTSVGRRHHKFSNSCEDSLSTSKSSFFQSDKLGNVANRKKISTEIWFFFIIRRFRVVGFPFEVAYTKLPNVIVGNCFHFF